MPTTAYQLKPWNRVAQPHPDVAGGALDMGTYAANLAQVYRRRAGVPAVYGDPERFFATTYVTAELRRLLEDVLGVLAGGPGDRVLQLRTPFGGGKTHTLVALLHLARYRPAAAANRGLDGLPDPGAVQVAVLSGEELDPVSPFASANGVETRTLWGELAAQLGRHELVAEHDRSGSAPGGDVLRRVLGDGPVLVLLDEVLVYVEKAMALQRGQSTLGRQAMLFLQALTEAVNTHPGPTAMVYSLQASAGEAVGAENLLDQLEHLVSRIDAKREPVSGDDVMRVVQRRLFADLGDERIHREVARSYADLVRRQLQTAAETEDGRREATVEANRLEERILASYPFHPALLDLMYHRWGSLPSYQRTRGALQFLASVTHALWERGTERPLIGPGEVDFADGAVRGAFFSQVGERERYTSVLDADIVAGGSGAAVVDRRMAANSPTLAAFRVGTRMASAIMLYSFGAREGEEKGVLESDLVEATLVPGLDRNAIVAALHDLREEELYLHYTGRRYRFEPKPNLSKLIRDEAAKLYTDEVLKRVKAALEQALPDRQTARVWPEGPEDIPDKVAVFTLAYLHPEWDARLQPLKRFVERSQSSSRSYRNGVGLVLPDPAQFDQARHSARIALAAESLLRRRMHLGFTREQVYELNERLEQVQADLDVTVSHAYDQVAVPVSARDGSEPYHIETIDLRTPLTFGRKLDQRVREALEDRVFGRLTVDKLVDLAGLGPERPAVRCDQLVDWFFSYFDYTKLWSAEPIAAAISDGVEEGRFAYATGVRIVDGEVTIPDRRLVRFRELLPTAEVDLAPHAAILIPEVAASLTGAEPSAAEREEPEPEAMTGRPVLAAQEARREPGPTDHVKHVTLRVRLDAAGLFGLNRALSWLRERSEEVDVEITVRAVAKGEGYYRHQLNIGVVEPLQEGGVADEELNLELS